MENFETAAKKYGEDTAAKLITLTQFKHFLRLVAWANGLKPKQMLFLADRLADHIQHEIDSIKNAPPEN